MWYDTYHNVQWLHKHACTVIGEFDVKLFPVRQQWRPRQDSAILSTFIKLPFVIKIFVLYILSGRFT